MLDLDKLKAEASAAEILIANYNDTIGDDEDAKLVLIEGETNLNEAIAKIVDRIQEDEAMEDALKARIATINERKKRFAHRAALARTCIASAMEQINQPKLELDIATLSYRNVARKAEIIDKSIIPTNYMTEVVTVEIDTKRIQADLRDGKEVPGAQLEPQRKTLAIRSS